MAKLRVLLRCIGEAIVCKGPKALFSLVPFGEVVFEVAENAWERLAKASPRQEQPALLAAAAAAGLDETRQEAAEAVRAINATAPMPLEAQVKLVAYLSQVPACVRQSFKRPADPTGRTAPPAFTLSRPEQLAAVLPARLPRFKSGDRPAGVGHWELVELLGAGGFGEVWKARHPSLGGIAPVALKFCLDPAAAAVLRHEAALLDRVMRASGHPGIVTLRQAYLEADPACLEYEYVAGGDLAGLVGELHRAGAPPRQANALLLALAEIVAHAHALDPPIVHRDLKPANVLVSRTEEGQARLRVADFGIGGVAAARSLSAARQKDPPRGLALTTSLRGAHTPLYASPQQVRGDDPSPADDVHALGVVWYQMLTGDLSAGPPADWAAVLRDRGQPAALVELLGACVASRPQARPADAGALAARLRAELDAEDLPEVLPVEEPILDALPADEPRRRKAAPTARPGGRPARRQKAPARSGNQVRHFRAAGLALPDLRGDLERWLVLQGFNVQDLPGRGGTVLLQIAQQAAWRKLTGMSSALNILLEQDGDRLTVEVGPGQWADRAAMGAAGLFVLWPLAVTAAVGAWSQMKLPEQVFTRVEDYLDRRASRAPAAQGLSADAIARLKELAGLRDQGVLTEEEFQAEKKRLLAG